MQENKFVRGQTVWVRKTKRSIFVQSEKPWEDEKIIETKIIKSGPRYVTAIVHGVEVRFDRCRRVEVTSYTPQMAVYSSRQQIFDEWNKGALRRMIVKRISDACWKEITLNQCVMISAALGLNYSMYGEAEYERDYKQKR